MSRKFRQEFSQLFLIDGARKVGVNVPAVHHLRHVVRLLEQPGGTAVDYALIEFQTVRAKAHIDGLALLRPIFDGFVHDAPIVVAGSFLEHRPARGERNALHFGESALVAEGGQPAPERLFENDPALPFVVRAEIVRFLKAHRLIGALHVLTAVHFDGVFPHRLVPEVFLFLHRRRIAARRGRGRRGGRSPAPAAGTEQHQRRKQRRGKFP